MATFRVSHVYLGEPGETITLEHAMSQTAITYAHTTLTEMTGEQIKAILEDVADNLFNPDPYYQQGGDMVRVGGLTYACAPRAPMGVRISDLRLNGAPLEAGRTYKVAGWASVSEESRQAGGPLAWDVLATYLRAKKTLPPPVVNVPRLIGVAGDPGIA
jgi:sulfur-oxidizing protein SoxB